MDKTGDKICTRCGEPASFTIKNVATTLYYCDNHYFQEPSVNHASPMKDTEHNLREQVDAILEELEVRTWRSARENPTLKLGQVPLLLGKRDANRDQILNLVQESNRQARTALEDEKRAAEKNLKYHKEKTKNLNLIREWKSTIFGMQLCIDRIKALKDHQADKKREV